VRPVAPRTIRLAVTAFTAEDFTARMARAARSAEEAGLAGVLVTPGPDLDYLCGYVPMAVTERLTLLVVSTARDPALLVPILERPEAERATGAPALALHDWRDGTDPYDAAAALLDGNGRYAVSDAAWAVHVLGLQQRLPGSGYVAMAEALPLLRAVKDDEELARMAAAGAAVDAAFTDLLDVRFSGRSESDVAADLRELLLQHGHSRVDFTVVASGPNGANPHHETGARMIEEGDMVVLDFGGLKDGYSSDTTRTVHVGEPTDEERAVHELVRQSQQAGFEAVRPGVACQDVDRAARAVIEEGGYGEGFVHRTGHGIGLSTHEPPNLVEGETLPLEPGMCFSVEPGIYLTGAFGVRIEDIVAVTEDGGRRLNTTPRELAIVA
jgi:D-alanyl-D-alanine dipeptidase